MTKLNPAPEAITPTATPLVGEAARFYRFPNGTVEIKNPVAHIQYPGFTEGTLLRDADNHVHVVANGWLTFEIVPAENPAPAPAPAPLPSIEPAAADLAPAVGKSGAEVPSIEVGSGSEH